jgi:hypothetical protein
VPIEVPSAAAISLMPTGLLPVFGEGGFCSVVGMSRVIERLPAPGRLILAHAGQLDALLVLAHLASAIL